jgi:O-methyltransferase involved in polyketide biosynthesis
MTEFEYDPTKASVAKVYDALQNGKDNFESDREAADAIRRIAEDGKRAAHDNRGFLGRAVRFLAGEAGIRQFLDIGTGLPAANNTHEVAQAIAPESRIVYVDNDPIVLAHAQALLTSTPRGKCDYLDADARDPEKILAAAAATLDFGQPVAVMLLAVLHFIEAPVAHEVVSTLMERMPHGSHLVISHASADQATPGEIKAVNEIYRQRMGTPIFLRPRDEIKTFFDGLELEEPGVTDINEWRNPEYKPARTIGYGGIALKSA